MKPSLSILNLEDNANDAELNEAMISARWPGCEFNRVSRRNDYIAALERRDFDLILSDYTMPDFDGRQALALAREKCPDIPFLFVSGTIGEDAAIEALKNGATDYVLKHRLMRLIPAVDRALREADEHAERERAEVAMRESEHKYREVFEHLSDAAFLSDGHTGKIIDTNRRAEILLGCNRAEILGRKQSQFLAVGMARRRPGANGMDRDIATAIEFKLICGDGTSIPVDVRATPLTLYSRALVLWLCHEIGDHHPA